MAGRIVLGIANPSLDANGAVAAGSTLTFYQNNTTTPVSIYTSPSLSVALANPLTCDAAGRFPEIWLDDTLFYSVKWSVPGETAITYNDIAPDTGSHIATFGNVTITGQLTYGGATLNAAVTGAGAMVLQAGPTLSGALLNNTSFTGIEQGTWSFQQSQNATSTFAFANNNSVSSASRAVLTVTGGNRFTGLQAIHGDNAYLTWTAGADLFLTNGTAVPGLIHFGSGVSAGRGNAANASFQLAMDTVTSRSINAEGTINASGADYAEYEKKRDDCGAVAKGQIVGFDADGLITDKWAAAISFGVKSTDPSYVGGDSWGTAKSLGIDLPDLPQTPVYPETPNLPLPPPSNAPDEEKEAHAAECAAIQQKHEEACAPIAADDLAARQAYTAAYVNLQAAAEAARQHVDRIAYSGKVPVNVMGAKPGDFIIAVQDGDSIGGQVVKSPAFDQYQMAVGRVRKILDDGRALIAVIVH